MAYSKAGMKAVDKYVKNNYDSILVRVPKGRKEDVEAFAATCPEKSVNGLMNRLLRTALGMTEAEWKAAEDEAGVHKTE
ncbi:MAG: ABC transporter ATP-binding protein [Clostridia bacterium]|nr:ABC transporter ATP-binding protein [Clostridia bacterium]